MLSKKHNSVTLKELRTFQVGSSCNDDAILSYFSALDTPRSLTCWLLYSYKENQQLVNLTVRPEDYNDPFRFRDDYQATEFLSKADFLDLPVSKKDAALSKFREFETLCSQTNYRFNRPHLDPLFTGPNVWLLNATKRKIASILGDFSPDEFVDEANWGPGVSTLLKGQHVSATNKFHSESGITPDLCSLIKPWFSTAYPRWAEHLASVKGSEMFTPQMGNVIVTVPKNSKTDRVIAIEPGLNLWFQKSVGSMIRRRLGRIGIDLNSQIRNQQLAKMGSKDSSLATVDFSSASDSISLELVRELLPPRWFLLLDSLRSKIGMFGTELIRWNKFSSMGNGFTFELESLIFFAAAYAVRSFEKIEGEISVFGDDVIIPNQCFATFSSFSEFLGFRVNKKKSFSSTYFRESCGSHYYDGIDCKPLFLKGKLRNVQSLYKLANGVRILAHRRNSYYGCDRRFLDCWRRLFRRVNKSLRFIISFGLGDSGFIGNFDEACPIYARNGIEGYYTNIVVDSGVNQRFEGEGLFLARLKVPSIQEYGNNYTLRGRTKTRIIKVLVPQWYNLGSWI